MLDELPSGIFIREASNEQILVATQCPAIPQPYSSNGLGTHLQKLYESTASSCKERNPKEQSHMRILPSRPWLSILPSERVCTARTAFSCAAAEATDRRVRILHNRSSPSADAETMSGSSDPSSAPKQTAVTSEACPRSTPAGGGGAAMILDTSTTK